MSHSFDIKNSKDLYLEFSRRVDEYQVEPMSSGNAVICAIFCWHIIEWISQEYSEKTPDFPKDFGGYVKKECPSISYMQDIANGSKHMGIIRYKPAVKSTKSHKGVFSNAFSKAFDVSCLKMELEDGKEVYFDEEINKAKEFIQNYFVRVLNENV